MQSLSEEKTIQQLVSYVIAPHCKNIKHADKIIQVASDKNIDLFKYLAIKYNLSLVLIFKRAAKYCNLAFSEIIPRNLKIDLEIDQLKQLKSIKSFGANVLGKQVIFTSPSAIDMLKLKQQIALKSPTYICIVPPNALLEALIESFSNEMSDEARQRLARRWPYASAHLDLSYPSRIIFLLVVFSLISIITFTPLSMTIYLLPLLSILFLIPAWFRISAIFMPLYEPKNQKMLCDDELPIYSVLIPLRDEAQMIPQLAKAMRALDYPSYKLDIKFIVESTSPKTIQAVREILDDTRFELIIVPKSPPHTKPKALDFALPLVRGKHLVIYDAEDIPEQDQLRKSASFFASNLSVDCIQAELVIDNDDESWLTALFCAEYSGLFGIMLPALSRWKFPMPLGGTSNHFRTSSLLEVGGWDAFNVTEDADLGLRFSRLRYSTGILHSKTYEEAPITLKPWIRQRTRWMKGWMQTFIVHNRHVSHFLADAGWKKFLAFQIYVGSLIISAPLHTIFLIILTYRFTEADNLGLQNIEGWLFVHLFFLLAGYSATILHSIVGLIRLKKYKHLWLIPTLPIYWALSGIASIFAAYELMVKPYFWAKTSHGITKRN